MAKSTHVCMYTHIHCILYRWHVVSGFTNANYQCLWKEKRNPKNFWKSQQNFYSWPKSAPPYKRIGWDMLWDVSRNDDCIWLHTTPSRCPISPSFGCIWLDTTPYLHRLVAFDCIWLHLIAFGCIQLHHDGSYLLASSQGPERIFPNLLEKSG